MSEKMWNDLNPFNPVHDICEYSYKDTAIIEDLTNLVGVLSASAEILTENHPIWDEIKIFKSVQEKYKRILHCDKCLQYLQKVGVCMRKMVLLNLSTVYLNLAEKLLLELQEKNGRTSYFLPSAQQLEYVLIRTQTAAKLICESLHYSRETFCYLIQRLKVGHLILNLMMATSVTARLNIVLKTILVQIFDSYKKIYVWRHKLKKGGYEWPKPLDLPEDLEVWMNLESDHLKPKHLPKEELDFLTSIFDEKKNSNDNFEKENEVISLEDSESVHVIQSNDEEEIIAVDKDDDYVAIVDVGEPLERSDIQISNNLDSQVNSKKMSVKISSKNKKKSKKSKQKSVFEFTTEEEVIPLENTESVHAFKSNSEEEIIVVDDDDDSYVTNFDARETIGRSKKQVYNNRDNLGSSLHMSGKQLAKNKQKSKKKKCKSIELTEAQKLLLEKIKSAEDLKGLKVIWDNLDVSCSNLLPKPLALDKIRLIDKVFQQLKRRISELYESNVTYEKKVEETGFLVKLAGLKFAKHLGLLRANTRKNIAVKEKLTNTSFVPAKNFKELRILFEKIFHELQTAQDYKRCAKLKKIFKSRKADIKLLIDNKENLAAKKLICTTSEHIFSKFVV